MKFIRTILKLIMSILLACIIICACATFFAARMLQKEEVSSLIREASVGKQIMNYADLEDSDDRDVYTRLREEIPVQVVLTANLSGDDAKICHEGALSSLEEMQIHTFAFSDMKTAIEALTEGYLDSGIDQGVIVPGRTIYYTTMYGRTRSRMDDLVRETVGIKYRDIMNKLADEDFFCSLDIDQKNTFAYLISTGKDKAEIQNGLYRQLEERYETIYSDAFNSYLERFRNNTETETLSSENFEADIMEAVYGYLATKGISLEYLNTEKSDRVLLQSIQKDIWPSLSSFLPSYESTSKALPAIALTALKMFLNNTVTYILAGIAALLGLILLLAGKKRAIGFLGFSFLLSGAALYLSRMLPARYADALTQRLIDSGNKIYVVVPAFFKAFTERLNVPSIVLAAAGLVLIILSLLINRKKETD
jgi:hypothetical protein